MSTPISQVEIEVALQGIRRPDFRIWIRFAYAKGQLDLLAQGIILSGKAQSNVEAILYMAEHVKTFSQKGGSKVTWGDVSKAPQNSKLQRTLSELITKEKIQGQYDLSRIHGTIGHVAIPELFSGNLIDLENKKAKQLATTSQLDFFPLSGSLSQLSKERIKCRLVDQTIALWEELRGIVQENQLAQHQKKVIKLRENIVTIFGSHALKILHHGIFENEYLSFLTFMTWAGALASFKLSRSFHLFKEIPVFPFNGDFSAGRIDALSVLKIGGQNPTQKQLEILDKMSKVQFSSVGHLIKDLLNAFGAHLELVIRDWKFAVGDGPKGMRKQATILKYEEMKEKPLPEHQEQIKRYLSTVVLSHALVAKIGMENAEEIWNTGLFTLKGQLIYLTPDNYPAIHETTLNGQEIKSVFQEQIVANFTSAERRSLFRMTSNTLMNHAIKLITEGPKIAPRSFQLVMDEMLSSVPAKNGAGRNVSDIVNQYRVRNFKDEFGVIEVVGIKDGNEIYEMHLDRLFEQVDKGNVAKARGFNESRGGHVSCLVHNEKSPSMHLSFSRGIFKCFGCGAFGTFAPLSIPDDVHVSVKPSSQLKKENSETSRLVIPKRHQEIMLAAQELVQQNFMDSRGASYLRDMRGLDPEISMSIGAGFANENLISGLLERGFSFAELVNYGFLGISTNVGEHSRVVEILKKHGNSLTDVTRFVYSKQKGQEPLKREKGLPYSFLENRVTYPLDIRGIINSFYGRAIDPDCHKSLYHRKLSNEHTDMPHGGFGLTKAMNAGTGLILTTEGAIDADTFFQKSDLKESGAIIGVNNQVLWEELAEFSGDIVIGFDHDAAKENSNGKQTGLTGQRSTLALMDALKQKGFKGQFYDFTAGFVKKNPEVKYKDTNRYWLDYRKPISVIDSIK